MIRIQILWWSRSWLLWPWCGFCGDPEQDFLEIQILDGLVVIQNLLWSSSGFLVGLDPDFISGDPEIIGDPDPDFVVIQIWIIGDPDFVVIQSIFIGDLDLNFMAIWIIGVPDADLWMI